MGREQRKMETAGSSVYYVFPNSDDDESRDLALAGWTSGSKRSLMLSIMCGSKAWLISLKEIGRNLLIKINTTLYVSVLDKSPLKNVEMCCLILFGRFFETPCIS